MPVTLRGYRVKAPINVSGRHNGVNVGILVSRLRDLGSRPGQFIVMCSWAKKICIQSLSPPRSMISTCKLSGKPGEMLGGGGGRWEEPCDGLTIHPGGSSNTPCPFMLWKPG